MATVGTIAINLITRDVSAMRGLRDLHSGVARAGVATQAARQQMQPALSAIEKSIVSAAAESRKWKNAAEEAAHAPAAHFRKLQGTMEGVRWNKFVAEMTITAKQEQALGGTTLALSNQFRNLESAATRAGLASRSVGGGGGGGGRSRAQHGLQEFGRGFEDFAISASTGGIAAGLRGATNNINAFLMAFGPWGAAASIVITLGTVLVGFWEKSRKGAEEAKKEVEDFRGSWRRLLDDAKQRTEFKLFMDKGPAREDVASRNAQNREELAVIDAQIKAIRTKKKQIEEQAWKFKYSVDTRDIERLKELDDQKKTLVKDEENPLLQERKRLIREINQLEEKTTNQRIALHRELKALVTQEKELGIRTTHGISTQDVESRKQEITRRREELKKLEREQADALRGRLHGDATSALSLLESAGQRLAPREFGELQKMMQMAEQREKIQQLSIPEAARAQLSQLVTAAGLQELRPEDNQPPKLMAMLQQGSAEAFNQAVRSSQKPPESKLDAQQLSALKELLTTLKGVEKNTAPQSSDTFSIP